MLVFFVFSKFNLIIIILMIMIYLFKGCVNMKKIELHLHLDGSLNIDYVNKIMNKDCSLDLISNNSKDLKEYLTKFSLPISLLQDKNNIEEFCYMLAKDLENDEVIYAEVRFCPLFHVEKTSIDELIEAMINGFNRVSTVKVNLIFCMMRHFDFNKNKHIIELTKKYLGKGVVAIDLAGDEKNFPTSNFEELFKIIREEQIPFTIHAGEADGIDSINAAINFGTKRIGHGVRAIENSDTVKKLIDNNILLEVCPKSNLDTNLVDDISKHPIKKLVDAGVLVSINTDNRTVSNTSLNYEYELLKNNFGFSDEDFIKFNINAINGAFISNEEKEELKNKLLEN